MNIIEKLETEREHLLAKAVRLDAVIADLREGSPPPEKVEVRSVQKLTQVRSKRAPAEIKASRNRALRRAVNDLPEGVVTPNTLRLKAAQYEKLGKEFTRHSGQRLFKWAKAGYFQHVGRGRYQITEAGREHFKRYAEEDS